MKTYKSVKIEESVWRGLKARAAKEGLSLNLMIKELLGGVPKVRRMVVADNILSHDLTDYVGRVRTRPGVESMTLPIGKGLEVTRIA